MAQYRKRPIIIEAVQYLNTKEGVAAVLRFAKRPVIGVFSDHLTIATLEGTMFAYPSDWIIRGITGEYYPIKDAIFRETYEPVL